MQDAAWIKGGTTPTPSLPFPRNVSAWRGSPRFTRTAIVARTPELLCERHEEEAVAVVVGRWVVVGIVIEAVVLEEPPDGHGFEVAGDAVEADRRGVLAAFEVEGQLDPLVAVSELHGLRFGFHARSLRRRRSTRREGRSPGARRGTRAGGKAAGKGQRENA